MQYKIKRPSQRWRDAILKDREPDTLHEIILGEGTGIRASGGLEMMVWDWELMERCYSSGTSWDGLKTDWFDYHDDYQAAMKPCPNLQFRDEHGCLQDKVGVKSKIRQLPSGHHTFDRTDDAGLKHDLSYQLIQCKGKTFEQIVCSRCGVVDEKEARIPIMTNLTEVKRWRNKQKTSFSVKKIVPLTSA